MSEMERKDFSEEEILRLSIGAENIGVNGTGIHPERTGGDIRILLRFRLHEEERITRIPDEHPLAAGHVRARVDAYPVAHADLLYKRNLGGKYSNFPFTHFVHEFSHVLYGRAYHL